MRSPRRLLFTAVGLWFLVAAYLFFFRKGVTLGGLIFVGAGVWFVYLGVRKVL